MRAGASALTGEEAFHQGALATAADEQRVCRSAGPRDARFRETSMVRHRLATADNAGVCIDLPEVHITTEMDDRRAYRVPV